MNFAELNVAEIDVADTSSRIPFEHGIYSFRQFGTAGLVDATRVDPYKVPTMGFGYFAALRDLNPAFLLQGGASLTLHVLKQDFFLALSMR